MKEKLEPLIGKKILIEGDIGTGKTTYTLELIAQAFASASVKRIVVIDMAPSRRLSGKKYVGGTLQLPQNYMQKVRYYAPNHIFAPRLQGKNKEAILEYAKKNAQKIEKLLQANLNEKKEILFINDMSMFFHAGDIKLLISVVNNSDTFIANVYKGDYFTDDKGSGITLKERNLLEQIEKQMDFIISL
jgi:hypothetical protein